MHSIPIKLPTIAEMQLRNNRLLRNAINNYRRHERYSNSSKTAKISSIKPIDEEGDILLVAAESLCPMESNGTSNPSLSDMPSKAKVNLTSLMKQIHHQCKNKTNKVCVYDLEYIFHLIISNRKTIN
jgi:hypothetical protein